MPHARRLSRWMARLVVTAGIAVLALVTLGGIGSAPKHVVLTAGNDFSITSTINTMTSPSPVACSAGLAKLAPGVPVCITYTAHNPLSVPITVNSMSIASVVAAAGCPATDLDLSKSSFAGSLSVPAHNGAASASAALSLLETGTDEDGCQGATFAFTYAGSGTYIQVFPTTTTLAAAPNPVGTGQQVTYTATVMPTSTPPGATTGSVAFSDGGAAITCGGGSHPFNGTTATCVTSYTTPGSHSITASFTNSDGNFGNSFSAPVIENVNQQIGACSGSVAGATVITGTSSTSYEVKNGATLWLKGGTIKGNVTVDATGQFTATGGTVKGAVTSLGGPVSIQNTTVGGTLTGTNATVGVGPGARVGGSLQLTGGAAVCVDGSATSKAQVAQSAQIQSLSGSTQSSVCAAAISGNLVVTGNGTPLMLGGSGCPSNAIGGSLTVQTNSGMLAIGAVGSGNAVTDNIQVQNNTGGGTLTANSAGGFCSLSGNTPKITGSSNTAKGTNTCNGQG